MFSRLELLIGTEQLKEIQQKKICIIGIGGVGGSAAISFVRSGIEQITIVDFDVVDETNLNRQVVAYHSTIGKKKIEVMKQLINEINPNCTVEAIDLFVTDENIETLELEKYDYVIDACDFVKAKKGLIRYCLEHQIPILSSMGAGNRLNPSQLEITDIRKTSGDPLARIFRKWIKEERITGKLMVVNSKEIPKKTNTVISSSVFVPNAAGNLIAYYIISHWLENKK